MRHGRGLGLAGLVLGLALAALLWRRSRRPAEAPPDPDLWRRRNLAGTEAFQRGELAEACRLFEQALELLGTPEARDRRHATCLNNLGAVHRALGQAAEAERCFREALAIRERIAGPASALTAQSLTNLADLLRAEGRPAEAARLYRRVLAVRETESEAGRAELARCLSSLAGALLEVAPTPEGVAMLRRLVRLREQDLGATSLELVQPLDTLARALRLGGQLDEAVEVARRALELRDRLPELHTDRATGLVHLALCLEARGDLGPGAELLRAAGTLLETQLGLLEQAGELEAAEVVRRRLGALRQRLDEMPPGGG